MYRRCNLVLFGLTLFAAAITLGVALWLEPLTGDLTRTGGYAEQEFGWNGREAVFVPPLALGGDRAARADIVVIGDSFSLRTDKLRQTHEGGYWTDFLAAETGLSVAAMDANVTTMDDFLASAAFRDHPPRLLILELVERYLKAGLAGGAAGCELGGRVPGIAMALHPMRREPEMLVRRTGHGLSGERIDVAVDYLRKTLLRRLLRREVTPVLALPLSRAGLFSSGRQDALLAYAEDTRKSEWSDRDWATMACRLRSWRDRVEANGRTRLAFVMVPDKSWAYASYLPAAPWQIDAAARLAPAAVAMPRVDLALRAAIAAGVADVYLPDDTHWGSAGARIAARVVARYLGQSLEMSVAAGSAASE